MQSSPVASEMMPSQLLTVTLLLLPLALAAAEGGIDRKTASGDSKAAAGGGGKPVAAATTATGTDAKAPGTAASDGTVGTFELPVVLPEYSTDEQDAYLCTSVQLPDRPLKLVGIASNSDQHIVHHMLLFGCKEPAQTVHVWNCHMSSACKESHIENVLYGWGKNAPAMSLPEGAGFSVGPGTSIRTVVLQLHYLNGRPASDSSGITLTLSPVEVPNSAGMVAFASTFTIPARESKFLVENTCCYSGWEPLHGFATRAHTHVLGREVYLDRWHPDGSVEPDRVISLDPQEPQGFYPIKPYASILPGDRLAMACRFNSSEVDHAVHAGSLHSDEMCNLYLMLYSQLPVFMWCLGGQEWVEVNGAGGLPEESRLEPETRVWQPPAAIQAAVEGTASKKDTVGSGFPVGQVPGLASTGDGTVWFFHRGDRSWQTDGSIKNTSTRSTSSEDEVEVMLPGPAVVQVNQDTGEVLSSWGAGLFVLPHMISLDWSGNVWVTDVTLHQAFKFSPKGRQLLALGTRMKPGSGANQFCKPTQVAVARSGNIFVADGYCNSRVAEFDANGTWLQDYTLPKRGARQMQVPHSVVVHECRKQLLVADREGGQVHAFQLNTTKYYGNWDLKQYGLPYALVLGPYGSVLALTWSRDRAVAQTFVVALGADPGSIGSHWEVLGVEVPHDLALAPAPLELTGAGERLMALVVSETKETGGSNLHKFVFMPGDLKLSNSSTSRSVALNKEEGEDVLEAHSHAGHGTAGGAQQEGMEGGQGKPFGMVISHIGHVVLKPVGSSNATEEAEGEVARVGHSMVKPVNASMVQEEADEATLQALAASGGAETNSTTSPAAKAASDTSTVGTAAASKPEQGQVNAAALEVAAEKEQSSKQQAATITAAAKPASKPPPPVQEQAVEEAEGDLEEAEWERLVQTAPLHKEEGKWQLEGVDEFDVLVEEDEGGEQVRKEARAAAVAGEHKAAATAVANAEEAGEVWLPTHVLSVVGHLMAQPWMLGLLFLGMALVCWNRLQLWQGRSGAGYHPSGHIHSIHGV